MNRLLVALASSLVLSSSPALPARADDAGDGKKAASSPRQRQQQTLLAKLKLHPGGQRFEDVVMAEYDPEGWITSLSINTGAQLITAADEGVTSLAPLAGLKRLQTLDIMYLLAADLRPLGRLQKLEKLKLIGCPKVTTLAPLAKLKKVREIYLAKMPKKGLKGLAKLPALEVLTLVEMALPDVEFLRGASALKSLNLGVNYKLKELGPLGEMKALEELELRHTAVTDLSPLAKLERLKTVRGAKEATDESAGTLRKKGVTVE